MTKICAVPTNIITGALGVGKTTFIKQLLQSKPANERWAVLINEFGEVGIDGAMLRSASQSVFIKEVPGGCMCCSSGLPMQVALNQLLAQAHPHRLFIEPTGLGHPKEVIQILKSEHYQQSVKSDFTDYIASLGLSQTPISSTEVFTAADLSSVSQSIQPTYYVSSDNTVSPPVGVIPRAHKTNEGFYSHGWTWPADIWFDLEVLMPLFEGLEVVRLKAVMITQQGIFSMNRVASDMTLTEYDEALDSRLEIIATSQQAADTAQKIIEDTLP